MWLLAIQPVEGVRERHLLAAQEAQVIRAIILPDAIAQGRGAGMASPVEAPAVEGGGSPQVFDATREVSVVFELAVVVPLQELADQLLPLCMGCLECQQGMVACLTNIPKPTLTNVATDSDKVEQHVGVMEWPNSQELAEHLLLQAPERVLDLSRNPLLQAIVFADIDEGLEGLPVRQDRLRLSADDVPIQALERWHTEGLRQL